MLNAMLDARYFMLDEETQPAGPPPHAAAQDAIRRLGDAVNGLRSLCELIDNGNADEPLEESEKSYERAQPLSEFLYTLNDSLQAKTDALSEIDARLRRLLFNQ